MEPGCMGHLIWLLMGVDKLTRTIDTALKAMVEDGELSIRIKGSCMAPLIEDGALVSLEKQAHYLPGDVIVKRCSNDEQLVAHRLIGCYPRKGLLYFVTQADSADVPDRGVKRSRIIGRIAGGECANSVTSVPVGIRIKATGQFISWVFRRLSHRRK